MLNFLVHQAVATSRESDAFLPDLAMSLNNLGKTLNDTGHFLNARKNMQEALAIVAPLSVRHPTAFSPLISAIVPFYINLSTKLGAKIDMPTALKRSLSLLSHRATASGASRPRPRARSIGSFRSTRRVRASGGIFCCPIHRIAQSG